MRNILSSRKGIASVIGGITIIALGLEFMVFRVAAGMLGGGPAATAGCSCAMGGSGGADLQRWIVGLVSVFMLSGIGLGLLYGIRTLVRTRRFLRSVIGGSKVREGIYLFESKRCEAFTFGFLRPAVALCAHCAYMLSPHEIAVMLKHESYHVVRRDPLKFLFLGIVQYMFFFIPLLKTLAGMYRAAAELEADQEVQNREMLGKILLRLVDTPERAGVASFASMVEMRIEKLLNPHWRMKLHLSLKHFFITGVFFGFALFVTIPRQNLVMPLVACAKHIECQRPFDQQAMPVYYIR